MSSQPRRKSRSPASSSASSKRSIYRAAPPQRGRRFCVAQPRRRLVAASRRTSRWFSYHSSHNSLNLKCWRACCLWPFASGEAQFKRVPANQTLHPGCKKSSIWYVRPIFFILLELRVINHQRAAALDVHRASNRATSSWMNRAFVSQGQVGCLCPFQFHRTDFGVASSTTLRPTVGNNDAVCVH